MTDARKEKIGPDQAVEMAQTCTTVTAARGKKIISYNIRKDAPSAEDLVKIMIGPSGNLRAPCFRIGKKMFIGFHEEELAAFVG